MLGTGEKTGDIDTMMESASRYFNDEARSALRISAIAAGVVAILAAGLMTAMQVVGFYGSYATKLGGGGD
jgi:type II secretory pathway component PulF